MSSSLFLFSWPASLSLFSSPRIALRLPLYSRSKKGRCFTFPMMIFVSGFLPTSLWEGCILLPVINSLRDYFSLQTRFQSTSTPGASTTGSSCAISILALPIVSFWFLSTNTPTSLAFRSTANTFPVSFFGCMMK